MIVRTEEDFKELFKNSINGELTIKNNIISRIEICVTAHFGNTVSFELKGPQGGNIFPDWNNTYNIGNVIKDFIEFYDLSREDGVELSTIKNIPIRCMYIGNKLIAIGDFMRDRWLDINEWLPSNYIEVK